MLIEGKKEELIFTKKLRNFKTRHSSDYQLNFVFDFAWALLSLRHLNVALAVQGRRVLKDEPPRRQFHLLYLVASKQKGPKQTQTPCFSHLYAETHISVIFLPLHYATC